MSPALLLHSSLPLPLQAPTETRVDLSCRKKGSTQSMPRSDRGIAVLCAVAALAATGCSSPHLNSVPLRGRADAFAGSHGRLCLCCGVGSAAPARKPPRLLLRLAGGDSAGEDEDHMQQQRAAVEGNDDAADFWSQVRNDQLPEVLKRAIDEVGVCCADCIPAH